ncbi:endoribonuclease YbeY [Tissierella creatinophila DSM 6911]|uniref:Endoribonuclease YbeY n=2 Tax=Tissierella creatinophila TaxID=79681 RepID=A0A1U7M7S6_TISCR|nr:endoribonuclease YbeY [Tissierella creatinophila DSM 6911]
MIFMEVFLDNRQSKVDIDEKILDTLIRVVKESLRVEDLEGDFEVSISFVENEEIKELNKEYRGIDKETDVLSFPLDEDLLVPVPLLGDIIISVEKALEQAQEYGHSLERELAYLTAHSMLHLCGHDHMENQEKIIMRDKEKEIMKSLGVFKGEKGV